MYFADDDHRSRLVLLVGDLLQCEHRTVKVLVLEVQHAEVVQVLFVALGCPLAGMDGLRQLFGSLTIDGKIVHDAAIVRRQLRGMLVVTRGLLKLLLLVEKYSEVDTCLVMRRLDGQHLLVVDLRLLVLLVALKHDGEVEQASCILLSALGLHQVVDSVLFVILLTEVEHTDLVIRLKVMWLDLPLVRIAFTYG